MKLDEKALKAAFYVFMDAKAKEAAIDRLRLVIEAYLHALPADDAPPSSTYAIRNRIMPNSTEIMNAFYKAIDNRPGEFLDILADILRRLDALENANKHTDAHIWVCRCQHQCI